MRIKESRKVHLDHLIPRESIRFASFDDNEYGFNQHSSKVKSPYVKYSEIASDWFLNIRKPDFQRETNAWTPEECLELIDSVVNERIIPSIILWRSDETGLIYVLDGAHRLSVIRAWLKDDWGDKNISYYARRDTKQIKKIAGETRNLINREIGAFANFKYACDNLRKIVADGEAAPRKVMAEIEFKQASFYSELLIGSMSLIGQWEQGDYNSAEKSFLRINKQGQPLNPWETTLIEFRKGSYARVIMSIANAGKSGHFWPKYNLNDDLKSELDSFPTISQRIFEKLFEPPFEVPINSMTVPMVVSPAYFQKHQYLFELIPLIIWNEVAFTAKDQRERLSKDNSSDPETVIKNGSRLLKSLDSKLEHIETFTNNSKSLSIVPLFYWYNNRGQYVRGLLYGFIGWMLSGSENDIRNKKLLFSSVRGDFERVFYTYKADFAALARNTGAGLKSVRKLSNIFRELAFALYTNNDDITSNDFKDKLESIIGKLSAKSRRLSGSRMYTSRDKTQINIRELFDQSTRCHICGGIYNLSHGGVQYDHVIPYRKVKETAIDNGRPSHPFCNNMKDKISKMKSRSIILPDMKVKITDVDKDNYQQILLFTDEEDFPL
ncbi:GmrSD restriction endonuclease domain-containing protein [Neolewinella sp.]|uniref:GmrSD restriction endonuclease domain-containing protein n=1 Tax=Neolewinella sp. TaxID=2993543 RepID=UPI003B523A72